MSKTKRKATISQLIKKIERIEAQVSKLMDPLYEQLQEITLDLEDRYYTKIKYSDHWMQSKQGQALQTKIDDLKEVSNDLDSIQYSISDQSQKIIDKLTM